MDININTILATHINSLVRDDTEDIKEVTIVLPKCIRKPPLRKEITRYRLGSRKIITFHDLTLVGILEIDFDTIDLENIGDRLQQTVAVNCVSV